MSGRLVGAAATLVALVVLVAGCARVPVGQPPRDAEAHRTTVAGAVITYCATRPIEEWGAGITRVVVAVHGLDRNACGMRRAVVDALGGEPEGTVVVAPHFAAAPDAVRGGHVWDRMGWPAGEPSSAGVSSYQVLDELVARFGERGVTLVGFSGGGQFTNRYAAVSPTTLARYVVINPSTYVWFTPDRPGPTASCPTHDRWRYGLEGRTGYVGVPDAAAVRERYATRTVHYLIGTADDDPRSSSLDRACGAMAQGANREERALNYHAHLIATFGPDIAARQPLVIVPGVGHDAAAMLGSPTGRTSLRP